VKVPLSRSRLGFGENAHLGGKVESFCFAFGDTDVHLVVDMPDNASVAAAALARNAGGGATSRTVALLTAAAEADWAVA